MRYTNSNTTHLSSVSYDVHNIGTESVLAQQTVNQNSDTVRGQHLRLY